MESLDERLRVVRRRRVSARERTKRRRKYRKVRSKQRRRGRRYRRSSRFRRLKRLRKKFSKRIAAAHRSRGRRVRVFVTSVEPTGDEVVERVLSGAGLDEPEDDGQEGLPNEDALEVDLEELRDDPDAAIEAMAHAYALVVDLSTELVSRLEVDVEEAKTPEDRAEAEASLAAAEDVLEDAEEVLDVVGSPEDDDEADDDSDAGESSPPEDRGETDERPGGEVAGVGWIQKR